MSAEADLPYSKKPFLLTLKGRITIHYMDGQTIEGEIAAQDDLNIWLSVDGTPHLIPRNQIRYIKGTPGQQIEPEAIQDVEPEAPPSQLKRSAKKPPEPEPVASVAQFVEEETAPLVADDLGGTAVIPPPPAKPPTAEAETDVPVAVINELADTGMTMILGPDADLAATSVADTREHQGGDSVAKLEPTSVSGGETELVPHLQLEDEDEDDVTFVLGESDSEEVSGHLICTTGSHAGEVFQLKPGITTIGRSSDNTIPLPKDKEASRRHSIIVYEASKFVIQDQNSLNGTFVNDELIKEPHPLANGDVILIGISTLKFQER